MRPSESGECLRGVVIMLLTFTFSLVSSSADAQLVGQTDTLHYKGVLASIDFRIGPCYGEQLICPGGRPGSTCMVAYTPGQEVDYKAMVLNGIYIFSYSSLTDVMSQERKDSLTRALPYTRERGSDYYLEDFETTYIRFPRSPFWGKFSGPSASLSKSEFDYICLGATKIQIPDFTYEEVREGSASPFITVRVPVYYITQVKTFTTKLK